MNSLNNIQNDSKILTSNVVKAESWLKVHETLVIVFMVLLVTFFALDKGMDVMASWEQHRASVAAAQVAVDKEKADAALEQAKSLLNGYQVALSASEVENKRLQEGIESRDTLLAAQQKKDAELPPSQLADRWQGLVNDAGIQPNTSGFDVSNTAALATVSKLEQVPVLQQNLKDEQAKSANLQGNVDKANELISQGKIAVNGLQLQLKDQDKSCKAEVAAVKAKARKGYLKAFGIGFVTGYVAGHFF